MIRVFNFAREQAGTDLVEYTLLLALICLVGAAAYLGMGTSTNSLWSITNSRLSSAANP
jgi:Flp pilus assembly pilin Flp